MDNTPPAGSNVQIEASWKLALADEFEKDYFQKLRAFLKQEKQSGAIIYPPGPLIFNAFEQTPFAAVKVVILGQDPYHNPGEAMGLSFSVPHGIRIPPSLLNIYKELQTDLGIPVANHGDLSQWAKQGVLLLNAMLTVRAGQPASHQQIGWQDFTDAVIRKLSDEREGLIFMLWGNFAKTKKALIDTQKHHVLEAAHSSPLAKGAFFGCKHFSKANVLLEQSGLQGIDWRVS